MGQLHEIPKLVDMGERVDGLDWFDGFIWLNGLKFVYMLL